jgi:DNA-binding CsgD family transcriptional regulator
MARKNSKLHRLARQRSLAVLARVRRGESLSQAARNERTTERTVRKHVGKQLRRRSSGRYRATRGDTLRRDLSVLGFDGYVPVVTRSSKQASRAAEHLIAVGRFLRTGDPQWLKPFVGKRVGGVELLTDPGRLQILADADLVKLDGLYRQNRGQGQEK